MTNKITTYSLDSQNEKSQATIKAILEAGGSISADTLPSLIPDISPQVLKASASILSSKKILSITGEGDDMVYSIIPGETTLADDELIAYNMIDSVKPSAGVATKVETNKKDDISLTKEDSTSIKIAPREKKIDLVSAKKLLPMLKGVVSDVFYTSTVAEELNLKPENIQDALLELSDKGYFEYAEEELGEGLFDPTQMFNDLVVKTKEEPIIDTADCSNDIVHILTNNNGSIGLSKIYKDLEGTHSQEVIEEVITDLIKKSVFTERKIGRGTTIEYPRVLDKVKKEHEAEAEAKAKAKAKAEAKTKSEAEAKATAVRLAKEQELLDIQTAKTEIPVLPTTEILEQQAVTAAETANTETPMSASNINSSLEIQRILDASIAQSKNMSEMLSATMIDNLQLKHRLAMAQAILDQHNINIKI